jgi:glycosyltransferase involved in cell wall biosynthesis
MSVSKVLMFGWEYPPHHSGGLGVACKGLAHALIDNNVDVCFVLPKTVCLDEETKVTIKFADSLSNTPISIMTVHLEKLARELQNPYITSVEYEKKLAIFIKHGGKIIPRSLFEEVDHYGTKTRDLFKQGLDDFDVIHAHDWLCYGAGIVAKELSGKPLIVHVHATEFDRCGGNSVNQQVYDRERRGMHAADHVIAVSELTRKIIIDKYGVDPTKVTVVHNGNSYAIKNPKSRFKDLYKLRQDGKKVVLFAGRITIQKGVDYFVHAAKKVLEYERNVQFIVAGSGDMEEQIKGLTSHLGIRDNFLFTGYYKIDEQSDLFAAADVVVMPSVSEPFGIIPLESMSNGTPVIMSKQSGVSEVVTHALKIDFWDTDAMADKILSIIRHPVLKQTLRDEGLRQVKDITWDKAAKKTSNIYTRIYQTTK